MPTLFRILPFVRHLTCALVFLVSYIGAARAEDFVWHFLSPTPTGNSLRRVAFLHDRFIAVGDAGTLLTSTDGNVWQDRVMPATYNIVAVTYGNGRYVASDDRSGLYTSTDGVHWSTSQLGRYYYWGGARTALLAYGNGIFLRLMSRSSASATSAEISTDAEVWQSAGSPWTDHDPFSLVFAQGRFVATSAGGDVWAASDGINWSKVANAAAPNAAALAAGSGAFVLARADSPCLRSTDGLNWFPADNAPVLARVAFVNDHFLGSEKTSNAILQSSDGIAWTPFGTALSEPDLFSSAFGNGAYVALNKTVLTELMRSVDGVSWASRSKQLQPAPSPGATIAYGNGIFLAPGVRSADGVHWDTNTFAAAGTPTSPTRLYFCHDRFIVLQDGAIYVSTDGRVGRKIVTITDSTEVFDPPLFALGRFFLPSNKATLVSTDGETWIRDATFNGLFGATAYGDDLFVHSDGSRITTSPDGINWTVRYTLPSAGPLYNEYHYSLGRPIYGNGRFLLGGSWTNSHGDVGDTLYTSADGITWSGVYPHPNGVQGYAFANGLFMTQTLPEQAGRAAPHGSANLPSPQFNVSIDGVTWAAYPIPADSKVISFAGNNDVFLASTDKGLLVTSLPQPAAPTTGALTFSGSLTLQHGSTVQLSVSAEGAGPYAFQWRRNGVAISGATSANYIAAEAGTYDVIVSNTGGSATSNTLTVTMNDSWLANVSSRAFVGTGEDVLIQGFVLKANGNVQVLARGIGPSLARFGVSETLADPVFQLHRGSDNAVLFDNDNWSTMGEETPTAVFRAVGAFTLSPGSKDAALSVDLPSGSYTFPVYGVGGGTGVALSELYDAGGNGRIVNLAARARVGAGDRTLIAGFVIAGNRALKVLIRGVGPSLSRQGITHPLANPKLTLFNAAGQEIHNNDTWGQAANAAEIRAAATATGAFALDEGSNDAAALETLNPGVYTAHVTSVDGSSGVALIEIYEAP